MDYKITSDQRIIQYIMSEYNSEGKYYKHGDAVKIKNSDGSEEIIGYVDAAIDNWPTGDTTYTVLTEKMDPSLSFDEKTAMRKRQTIVYILSKGSEGPEQADLDAFIDWLPNNALLGARLVLDPIIGPVVRSAGDPTQFTMAGLASTFTINSLMNEYPNAKFIMGGHSQGSANLQYSLAYISDPNKVIAAFINQGPNIFPLLSKERQDYVGLMKNRIFNFIDEKDKVPYGYNDPNKMVGQLLKLETISVGMAGQHGAEGYKYDSKGNIIFRDYNVSAMYKYNLAKIYLSLMQHRLNDYFSQYHGSNIEIYIEYRTVEAVLESLDLTIYNEISAFKENIKLAIQTFEQNWNNYLNDARLASPDLSEVERLDFFNVRGANEIAMVLEPKAEFEKISTDIDYIYQDFLVLLNRVRDGIKEVQRVDGKISDELF